MTPWAHREIRSRLRRCGGRNPAADAAGRGQGRGDPRRLALALSLAVAAAGAPAPNPAQAAEPDGGDVVVALTASNTVTVTVPDGARVPALTAQATTAGAIAGVAAPAAPGRDAARAPTNVVLTVARPDSTLQCANWIYAGAKSSVCFSPKFLETVSRDTNIEVAPGFTPVRLAARSVFEYPFAVMTGEGSFSLQEEERRNLKEFLGRGGRHIEKGGGRGDG